MITVAVAIYLVVAMGMAFDSGRLGLRKGSGMFFSLLWPVVLLIAMIASIILKGKAHGPTE